MSQTEFLQTGPEHKNPFDDDRALRELLERKLPKNVWRDIQPGLQALGQRALDEIRPLGDACEQNNPRHLPYDAWGHRVDLVQTDPGWPALAAIAAQEGIVATAYERTHEEWSRLHQFVRVYLYNPYSAIFSCPLAMTDGAARLIDTYGDAQLKSRALPHLLSRDPATFWTSGQWMTERSGGSDLAGSETEARLEDGQWRLYGTKFFTSSATSPMAMTLARLPGAPSGSRGLSLFYVESGQAEGRWNNIEVLRLKSKLGTRALPTAEFRLHGTPATLVGGEGHGIKKIATLFNITRIHNAVCAVGLMSRAVALARDFSYKRSAFGRSLASMPLHLETLASMQVEYEGGLHLVMHIAELLGREETEVASPDEVAELRLLTPIAKLYTGKQGIAVASECIEALGGTGYMEDSGMPRLLRDGQTLAIWEGTTNVLSLDTLRAIQHDHAWEPFVRSVHSRLVGITAAELKASAARTQAALDMLNQYLPQAVAQGMDFVQAGARQFAYAVARVAIASLLLEHAEALLRQSRDKGQHAALSARRWCAQDLIPLAQADATHREESRILALDL